MFEKRKLEYVVNELECSVEALQKRNVELTAEVGRLERILKYSSDAPSCRFIIKLALILDTNFIFT